MPTFVLSDEAEIDITGISQQIAGRNLAAAIKMLDRIEETCQMLADTPDWERFEKASALPVAVHLPSVGTSYSSGLTETVLT